MAAQETHLQWSEMYRDRMEYEERLRQVRWAAQLHGHMASCVSRGFTCVEPA